VVNPAWDVPAGGCGRAERGGRPQGEHTRFCPPPSTIHVNGPNLRTAGSHFAEIRVQEPSGRTFPNPFAGPGCCSERVNPRSMAGRTTSWKSRSAGASQGRDCHSRGTRPDSKPAGTAGDGLFAGDTVFGNRLRPAATSPCGDFPSICFEELERGWEGCRAGSAACGSINRGHATGVPEEYSAGLLSHRACEPGGVGAANGIP